jgi:hypothetical protein
MVVEVVLLVGGLAGWWSVEGELEWWQGEFKERDPPSEGSSPDHQNSTHQRPTYCNSPYDIINIVASDHLSII